MIGMSRGLYQLNACCLESVHIVSKSSQFKSASPNICSHVDHNAVLGQVGVCCKGEIVHDLWGMLGAQSAANLYSCDISAVNDNHLGKD